MIDRHTNLLHYIASGTGVPWEVSMNLKRDLKRVGASLTVITIPSGGRQELDKVCDIANEVTRTFLEQRGSVGAMIDGSWDWRHFPYESEPQRSRKGQYPAIVFIGTIRTTTLPPNEQRAIVDFLSEMVQYLITQIEVDFNAAPMRLHFNESEYHLTKEKAPVMV